MTEFERKQLDILKTINRNINYVGRKLEMIDSTLQKHGITIIPGAEAVEEEHNGENITLLSTENDI